MLIRVCKCVLMAQICYILSLSTSSKQTGNKTRIPPGSHISCGAHQNRVLLTLRSQSKMKLIVLPSPGAFLFKHNQTSASNHHAVSLKLHIANSKQTNGWGMWPVFGAGLCFPLLNSVPPHISQLWHLAVDFFFNFKEDDSEIEFNSLAPAY